MTLKRLLLKIRRLFATCGRHIDDSPTGCGRHIDDPLDVDETLEPRTIQNFKH